jgi:hypothetical protein
MAALALKAGEAEITANRRSSLTFGLKPEVLFCKAEHAKLAGFALRLSHGLAVRWDEKFRTKVTGFSTQVNFAKFPISTSPEQLEG